MTHTRIVNVVECGAAGYGTALDTTAINRAIEVCASRGGGQVLHRTGGRHNMLAGILLQPGAWGRSDGPLEDVLIADVTMRNVAAPVSLWLKEPGNTTRDIVVSRLSAFGVYRAAASIESWTPEPIRNVAWHDVAIQFTGAADHPVSEEAEPPFVDVRPLPAWGFYARNVEGLRLESVRLVRDQADSRPRTRFDHGIPFARRESPSWETKF